MAAGSAAAGMAVLIAALLVAGHLRYRQADPLNSALLAKMKAALAENPKDRQLAQQVRRRDAALREEHFRHVTFARRGNWLLLACAAIFLAGVKSALAAGRTQAPPGGNLPEVAGQMSAARRGRWAVGALAAMLAAGAATPLAITAYIRLTTVPPPPPHFANPADVARYWTQFRGDGTQGRSAHANVPTVWDANANPPVNILWKSPLGLPGKSSPVVWGDRVFLTGATDERREVYCYGAGTGKLVWTRAVENVPGSPVKPKEAYEETGCAASSPVCDDRHVFALFHNGDLACFTHDGRLVWAKGLGQPNNTYTHGSSLVMYRNLVLVLWDQGKVEDYMSRLLAFDGATGRLVWQQRRPVGSSWATPSLIFDGQRDQFLTSADPWVISYDPASGSELWRAKCMESADVASSVAWAAGVAYAVSNETKLFALRTDGSGDVTPSHVLWQGDEGLTDLTSPLTDGKHVWLIQTGGTLTCYDAATGKVVYQKDLEKSFNASPGLAGGKLYLLTVKGEMFIVGAGGEYKLLGTNRIGEAAYASPVFQDGRIYLRGSKHLFCIAETFGGAAVTQPATIPAEATTTPSTEPASAPAGDG